MIPISKQEALDRLAEGDPLEVHIEAVPNNGTTAVQKESRQWCIDRINRSRDMYETGIEGQRRNMGINTVCVGSQKPGHIGLVMVFFPTKPELQLSEADLAESLARGHGLEGLSSVRSHPA